MISVIGLKEGINFGKLPNEVKEQMLTLFPDWNPSDFKVWFRFSTIDSGKKGYKLFVPFLNKIVTFPKTFFDVKETTNNKELEKRYDGTFYETPEGKETLQKIIKRHQDSQEKSLVREVTSTGSVGGSFETAFPASDKDMKELEYLKRNPHKIYVEDKDENKNKNNMKYILYYYNSIGLPKAQTIEGNDITSLIQQVLKKNSVKSWDLFKKGENFNRQQHYLINFWSEDKDSYWYRKAKQHRELKSREYNGNNNKMNNSPQIVEEIAVSTFKKLMTEKYVYNSPASKNSAKNTGSAKEAKPKVTNKKAIPEAKNDSVNSKNRRLTDDEKISAHQNSQADIEYEGISETAKENNEANIKNGDGGTDGLWAGPNYSDPKLGEKIIDDAKTRSEDNRTKKAKMAGISVGDDFESIPEVGVASSKHGFKEGQTKTGKVVTEATDNNITASDKNYRTEKGKGFYFFDKNDKLISFSKYNSSTVKLAKRSNGEKIAPKVIEVQNNGEERTFDHSEILNKNGYKLEENKATMKKYKFANKIFESSEAATAFIPSKAKKHDNIFLMEDKNENQIKFQWVGNNKGSVALLEEKFPQKAQLLEDQRSRLTSYDSEATLGTSSVNEDNFFYNMLSGVDSDVTSEKV